MDILTRLLTMPLWGKAGKRMAVPGATWAAVTVPKWQLAMWALVISIASAACTGTVFVMIREARLARVEERAVANEGRVSTLEQQLQTIRLDQALTREDLRSLNPRLCRMERALHIDPWETCAARSNGVTP